MEGWVRMDTLKEDGTLAELTDRAVVIAQGGDPDRVEAEPVVGATDGEGGTDALVDDHSEAAGVEAGTAGAGQDAEAGGDKEVAPWYGDDDLELAKSYGLTAEQLGGFADADEFQRAAMFFDQQLKLRDVAPEPPKPEPEPAKEAAPAEAQDDLDPEWYAANGYEEETVKIVRVLKAEREQRKALEASLQDLAQWRVQAQAQAEQQSRQAFVESFHDAVDSLGDELFGTSIVDDKVVELSPEIDANRRRLFEAVVAHGDRFGDVPLRVKVRRAMNMEFGDALRERDRKQLVERVARQSRKRRPVASANRMRSVVSDKKGPPDNPYDVSDITGDEQFQRQWKQVIGKT